MTWTKRFPTLALAGLVGLALALAGCTDAEESGEPATGDDRTTPTGSGIGDGGDLGDENETAGNGNETAGDGNESEGVCVNNTADPYQNPCPGEQDRDIPALETNTSVDQG